MNGVSIVEWFSGENGKHIMLGFMFGAPMGYSFAVRTSLNEARNIIKEKNEEIKELRTKLDAYISQLIQS